MRYYEIIIDDGASRYTSHPRGNSAPPDPGALQVEMDLWAVNDADADVNSHIKIFGVSLQTISEAHNLNPAAGGRMKNILVYGGMGKGLPLAKPGQAGVLVKGGIAQAFGNWVGTNMTLDLVLTAGYTGPKPNLVIDYKAGQAFDTAVKNALATAFPKMQVEMKVKSLKAKYDQPGFYGTINQFADYVRGFSRVLAADDAYPGYDMFAHDGKITVHDGTAAGSAIDIAFEDLVGQPTYSEPNIISVTTVMRGDIMMGNYINLPKGLVTTTAQSLVGTGFSSFKNKPTFQGKLKVNKVHHLGSYKSPAGDAWVTVLNCVAPTSVATTNITNQQDTWPPL